MNIINILKEKGLIEKMYLAAISCYSFLFCFQSSKLIVLPDILSALLYFSSFSLAFPKVIFSKYSRKDYYLIAFLYIFTFLFIILTGKEMLIILPTLLVGTKNIDLNKCAKIVFYICTFFVLLHSFVYIAESLCSGMRISDIFTFMRTENRSTVLCADFNIFAARSVYAMISYLYFTNREN